MSEFINGAIGGIIGCIISHPIDTIKSRIQTGYTVANAIKFGHFYKGIISPLIGIPFEKTIVFGFYDISYKYTENIFISGLVGGLSSTIIVTPIEYIKINMQNNNYIDKSNFFKNCYKGIIPTIMRETPGFGIYFSTYNYLKQYNQSNELYKSFIYGGISGLSAWIFIYPADLIKTISQTTDLSLKHIIKNIYYKNKFYGFYKGFSFAVMRAVPLHSGVFFGYELSKVHLFP